jgi:hypothetical protein
VSINEVEVGYNTVDQAQLLKMQATSFITVDVDPKKILDSCLITDCILHATE